MGGVGKPSWRDKKSREVLWEGQEVSRGMGGVGSLHRRAGRIRRPSWRDGMGWEGRERSEVPPGGTEGLVVPQGGLGGSGSLLEGREG